MKNAKLEHEWILDVRSQKRYMDMGVAHAVDIAKELIALPDLSNKAVNCIEPQPALGLFDKAALKRVQNNFPKDGTKSRGY